MAGGTRGAGTLVRAAVALSLIASFAHADARAPSVQVTPGPDGTSEVVHGVVEIAAPPPVVWAVMTDPVAAPRLVVNMRVSRTIEHDPAGRYDVREQITKGGLFPGVRTVVRTDYQPPDHIRFHRVDGDVKLLEGEWRLVPLDGGARTRLTYDSRLVPPFPAPGGLVRSVLRKDMPQNLANLRDAAEARAARP